MKINHLIVEYIIEATRRLEKKATEEELTEIKKKVSEVWRKYYTLEDLNF